MKRILSILFSACLFIGLSAQDYTQVYIIGSATSAGWTVENAIAMTPVSSDEESAVFTWTGPLTASEFKFVNQQNWNNAFVAPTPNEQVVLGQEHKLVYRGPDYKFIMQQDGFYTITIDLKKLTMTVVEAKVELPEELWVTGTAIPDGTAKLANAPGVSRFIYIGELQEGDFKIISSPTIDESTQYIVPAEGEPDANGKSGLIITADNSKPGWKVATPATAYKVRVDLAGKTLDGSIHQSREELYIVGGVIATGWAADKSQPFTRDEVNPDLFIFDGEFTVDPNKGGDYNLFKILGQLAWGPYSIHPYTANEPLLESNNIQINVSDNKWKVDEDKQGRYIIKVNTLYETIEAQYIPETTAVKEVGGEEEFFRAFNTSEGLRIRMAEGRQADFVQLIGMDGRLVHAIRQAGNDFLLGGNAETGIYLLKIDCGKKSLVQRVVIK